MNTNLLFALALGIGIVAGLRSLTAPAMVCWAAHLGWVNLHGTPLAFMGSTWAVVIFSLLALVEFFGDVNPKTPARTTAIPLTARIVMGALSGACLYAAASQALLVGAVLGAIGAVIGAFAGYNIRKALVSALKVKDIVIGLAEDVVTIGLAYWILR